MKKFELTDEYITKPSGTKLFRIRALVDFLDVQAGDKGGYIESEENLSQNGTAWVYDEAQVYGNAQVTSGAQLRDRAQVFGYARIFGSALIGDNAQIHDFARVCNHVCITGNARVYGNAQVTGDARIYGDARICEDVDYAVVKGFGRCCRTTTFFRCRNGKIRVTCGCFLGDISEFRKRVKETHGTSKMAKEYLAIADLMELHFGPEVNRDDD